MGENLQIGILVERIKNNIEKIANTLNWDLTQLRENGQHSYVVCKVEREGESHKFAILYSQSTDRTVYQSLAQEVEIIFINGGSIEENNYFSRDCSIPVIPENEFLYVITDWNMEFLKIPLREEDVGKGHDLEIEAEYTDKIYIVEENLMEQIYSQLQALTSKTIAFMEAEMLMIGDKYKELSEIKSITKNGHGMMTFGTAENGLNDFFVGVINQGLFPMWMKHRRADISMFPNSKKDAEKSEIYHESLNSLLYCIPELENILMEIDENFKPGYLFPYYDMLLNHTGSMIKNNYYRRKYVGSYVDMIDQTKRADKQLVQELSGSICSYDSLCTFYNCSLYAEFVSQNYIWKS